MDSQTYQILFLEDSIQYSIKGETLDQPFTTPYSARRIETVKTLLYTGCDTSQEPQISGDIELSAFQNQQIDTENIKFESESE